MRTLTCTLALSAMSLGLTTGTTLAQDAPAASAPAAQSNDILDKSFEAMGGKAAIKAIKSRLVVMSGNVQGMTIELEVAMGQKGKFHGKQSAMGMTGSFGSDGEVTWAMNPQAGGYELVPEEQASQMSTQLDMLAVVLNMGKDAKAIETVGKEDYKGTPAHKVQITDKDDQSSHYYIDAESYLPLAYVQEMDQGMGPMKVTMSFADWKPAGDLKVCRKISLDQMGMAIDFTLSKVEFNNVDSALFELPEEVKKLVADQPATQPAAGDGEG